MTLFARFQTILTVALMVGLAVAPLPARAADRDRLDAFLEVTGFGVSLDSIALSAEDAPQMLGFEASDFGLHWTRLANGVFDTGLMRDMALDILGSTLSNDLLNHAAGFYASDLGQRLVVAENASHMEEDGEMRRRVGGEILAADDGTRSALLLRLNDAVDSAGMGVRSIQEVQVRFLMAASNAGVLDRPLDEAALRAIFKEREEEMRQQIRANTLASAAYTYRDFDADDLVAYAEALEHPDMQEVYVLMNAVQYEIMADRFEELAAQMAGLRPAQEL